jgi:RimJ/RimL family protein N-acetyltransferase
MADTPRLTDGVIVLDAFTLQDLEDHIAGEDEEQARRFGWYPKRSTAENFRAAWSRWQADWESGGATRAFAMRELTNGALVGGCEIRLREPGIVEISYWTLPPHRRKGYATRALRLASDFAFAKLGIDRIEAYVEPNNEGSRRAVQAGGFVEEALVRQLRRLLKERSETC